MEKHKWTILADELGNATNPKDKNHQYLHGIVWGMDYTMQYEPHVLGSFATDVDQTTYHALVKDDRLFDPNSDKKDPFTGKNMSDEVERFKTTDVEEARAFFFKYNNPKNG